MELAICLQLQLTIDIISPNLISLCIEVSANACFGLRPPLPLIWVLTAHQIYSLRDIVQGGIPTLLLLCCGLLARVHFELVYLSVNVIVEIVRSLCRDLQLRLGWGFRLFAYRVSTVRYAFLLRLIQR